MATEMTTPLGDELDWTVVARGPKGDKGDPGPSGADIQAASPLTVSGTGTTADPYVLGITVSEDAGNTLTVGADGGLYAAAGRTVASLDTPGLDLTVWPVMFTGQAPGSPDSMVQTVAWDSVDECWYTGQRYISDTDLGRIMVSRLSRTGELQDSMVIEHSDHGAIGIERTADTVFVWTGADATDDQARALARIPYTAGATVDAATEPWLTPRPGAYRVSCAVDPVNRTLTFRWQTNDVSSPSADAYLDLYDLDQAAAGTFEPLASIPHPSLTVAMQGFTSLGGIVYDYWGNGADPTGPVLRAFEWTTGAQVDSQVIGALSSLTVREPEGLCVYDQDGRATLAFGFGDGVSGGRNYNVARLPFPDTAGWTLIDYDTSLYVPNSDNYLPQYRLDGDRVWLHFSLRRVDGAPWDTDTTLFTLPTEALPDRTQRLTGVCGAQTGTASTIRLEATADGAVSLVDGRGLMTWVGADCTLWRC